MSNKIKVFFFLPNLKAGGAERVMSFVAQNIDKDRFETTLYVIGQAKDQAFETSGVKTIFFNKNRVFTSIPILFKTIRKEKPKVVITAIGHLNITMAFISLLFPKTKFIGREVNVISVLKNYSDSKKRNEFSLLSILAYKILDKVICQSNDMAQDLMSNYRVKKSKIKVINNPITGQFRIKHRSNNKKTVFQLITVGRLAKQKGHLRVLKCLKELKVPFHYTIVGDGTEKKKVLEFVQENGLSKKITHVPFTANVSDYLSKSDVFLQGSYVEGFPNALIESFAVGTPAIAYRAKGGIDEIIQEGVNGFMVSNDNDFNKKLEHMLETLDNWSPSEIADTVNKKYSAKVILKQYEDLITSIK